jgi:adenylosuccinate lyase
VERVVLADSCILTDYLLAKTLWVLRDLRVFPGRMQQNVDLTQGLVFSGQVLLDLAAAGVLREDAYRIVQSHAMHAWESGESFRDAISKDAQVSAKLSPRQLDESFSLQRQLSNVGAIYARVFGEMP